MKEGETSNIENSILPKMGRTMKALDYFIADKLKENGFELTKVQLILLKNLKYQDGQPQNNLAHLTNRDKASLARLLTTMEKKNLVARIPSKSDHRINNIHITKHGDDMLKQAGPIFLDIIRIIQEGIPKKDIDVVIRTLKKISQNINSEELVATLTK
jgi:DNA-binding MarR family transcriptional regulator